MKYICDVLPEHVGFEPNGCVVLETSLPRTRVIPCFRVHVSYEGLRRHNHLLYRSTKRVVRHKVEEAQCDLVAILAFNTNTLHLK